MDTTLQVEHEQATIKAFVVQGRQDRFSSFLSTAKNRKKFTRELSYFPWFDGRFAKICRLLRVKRCGPDRLGYFLGYKTR